MTETQQPVCLFSPAHEVQSFIVLQPATRRLSVPVASGSRLLGTWRYEDPVEFSTIEFSATRYVDSRGVPIWTPGGVPQDWSQFKGTVLTVEHAGDDWPPLTTDPSDLLARLRAFREYIDAEIAFYDNASAEATKREGGVFISFALSLDRIRKLRTEFDRRCPELSETP